VEQILGLITNKLMALTDARDWDTLNRKSKAITALFPYAVWQERDEQYKILDALLRAARVLRPKRLMWYRVEPFLGTLLNDTSHISLKRTAMLVSPCFPWDEWHHRKDLIRAWVATASVVPKEEQVAPSVVETLLQISYHNFILLTPNPGDIWSWLTLRPYL